MFQHPTTAPQCSTTLQHNTTPPHCNTELQHHNAAPHCSTTLQHRTAAQHYSITLQHNTTIPHCSMCNREKKFYRFIVWFFIIIYRYLVVAFNIWILTLWIATMWFRTVNASQRYADHTQRPLILRSRYTQNIQVLTVFVLNQTVNFTTQWNKRKWGDNLNRDPFCIHVYGILHTQGILYDTDIIYNRRSYCLLKSKWSPCRFGTVRWHPALTLLQWRVNFAVQWYVCCFNFEHLP